MTPPRQNLLAITAVITSVALATAAALVPQLGDDVDHNPQREQGILPGHHPSLTGLLF